MTQKKRVLFINGHLNTGGIERSLVDVLRHLDPQIFDIELLLLQGEGEYRSEIPDYIKIYSYNTDEAFGSFASTIVLNFKKRNYWAIIYRLVWCIYVIVGNSAFPLIKMMFKPCRIHYDAAIAYRHGLSTTLLAYAIHATKKISWWHHGCFEPTGKAKESLYQEYCKMDNIVAVSENTRVLLYQQYPDLANRIKVVNNMIDVDAISQKAESWESIKASDNLFTIASVGRLYQDKNARMCSLVAAELKKRGVKFRWFIIGEGEERAAIERDITDNGMSDCVFLTGSLSNPYPYMKASDLVFHASPIESQGLTILEAMALGTPVVCVRSAGPSEFIQNGVNGIMIENDVMQAADVLSSLIGNRTKLNYLSISASETVTRFCPEAIAHKIVSLF